MPVARSSRSLLGLIGALCVAAPAFAGDGPATPPDLRPIGGRWSIREGTPAAYLYRDGDRFVDLFSYHRADSNGDGIDEVRLAHDDRALIIDSQGYPNHPTALFPNSGNPNRIVVQDFRFRLPLEPRLAGAITRVPMGPIGVALNGVVFFNPFEIGGMNAVEGYSEVWLDSCCGHPQQTGVYHYHKYPSCVKSPFPDDGKRHSPILGFAFDGFPVHGPYESAGRLARDLDGDRALDSCNGHEDPSRGYHYHVTPGRFPYILGGYAGVPEPSNNRGLARATTGAIVDNATGTSDQGAAIRSVRPGSAARGRSRAIRIELDPAGERGDAVPDGAPSWVQVGPFEASRIGREGDVVTAEIAIPDDAPVGLLLDCHLEFRAPGARGRVVVFKKNDAFRVAE